MNKGDLLRIALHKDLEEIQEDVNKKADKEDLKNKVDKENLELLEDKFNKHTHSWGQITNTPDFLLKSGGQLTGKLYAESNTNYSTSQVRNITLSTNTPSASQMNNGDIWIKYE